MTKFNGVYAAALTPRTSEGVIDSTAFEHQLAFLSAKGIKGFALNGATGEFPAVADAELETILQSAERSAPEREVLCGIGGANLDRTISLGRIAVAAGADALLLPMPFFFPYRQDDLISFVSSVADRLDASILLYNLPQFTTGLNAASVIELMRRHEQIVGIKDSSGSLEIVSALTTELPDRARLIGNDSALAPALQQQVCDGVVSGVACALPELILSFFEYPVASQEFNEAQSVLAEFIEHLNTLPTPWGLKVASAARQIAGGEYPWPLSPAREVEVEALHLWFSDWFSTSSKGSSQTGDDHTKSKVGAV